MRFIDDAFPLIISISDPVFDANEVRAMADGFERYFARGERYAVFSTSPNNATAPGQRERKMIADWAGHPRVKEVTKRLCVGSATLAQTAVTRAALTVIMAFWKPASPYEIVPSVERGLDYCLRRLAEEGLQLPKPPDLVRYEMRKRLEEAL